MNELIKDEVIKSAQIKLKKANINNDFLYAKDLFEFNFKNNEFNEDGVQKYFDLIQRKINGEPFERILGVVDFYGVKIKYSDNVLTPRQETEILVDMIASENKIGLKLLDMCAGSGCIGISLLKNKKFNVTLCDISEFAINNEKENLKLNNLNCEIIKSNLFENIHSKYDIIVSNPPYIKTEVINNLEKEVLNYDPILALDGGSDGMKFYRKIINEAPNYLNKLGKLYLEIDNGLNIEIENLLKKDFKDIRILKDFSGNFRFAIATKKE